ncbi:MAG: flagellar protein FlgN [Lacunisphaera sp.]|nr:flagellar protein FlgN [Lacunisphaera sp.]
MNQDWTIIADRLRQEVVEYGGLLQLFGQQEEALYQRDADGVLRLSSAIEQQVLALHDFRRRREEAVAAFATAHGCPATATLRSLLPQFAPAVRPLIEALLNEVNVLVHRVRRMSRHNHTLLARAVATHQQTLRALRPGDFTQTYAPNGRSSISTVRPAPALQAAS